MNRRALAIGAGAVVVLLLLWYVALWSPAGSEMSKAEDRRVAAEDQAVRLRSEIQRLQAAQRNEPEQRAKLERLKANIPDDPNLAQFILDTNDAAVRSGIDFISVAPAVPVAGAAPAAAAATTATTATTAPAAGTTPGAAGALPAEIRVTLQIRGGYFQVLDFLNRLDQMPRLVVTDSLNVSSDAAAVLTVSVSARMFTKSVPAAFGGPAAPPSTTATTVAGATTTTVAGATTTTAAGATTTTAAGATP